MLKRAISLALFLLISTFCHAEMYETIIAHKTQQRHKVLLAACLVLSDGPNVVLGLRKSENQYGLIGGHLEVGETVYDAVIREAKEEANINLQPDDLNLVHVMHYQGKINDYVFFFIQAQSWKGTLSNVEPDKCAGWEWFDCQNLPNNVTRWSRRGLENIQKGILFSEYGWKDSPNYIVVHGVSHLLEVYGGDGDLLNIYPIGVGRGGMGKNQQGDLKTPIGEYHILWKASRYAQTDGGFLITEGQAYCKKDNSFALESEGDKGGIWDDRYGGDQAVFMCLDYPNFSDQEKGYTGNGIAIHTGFEGVGEDSSLGCIRMYPSDARDLYSRVVEGAAVFILND